MVAFEKGILQELCVQTGLFLLIFFTLGLILRPLLTKENFIKIHPLVVVFIAVCVVFLGYFKTREEVRIDYFYDITKVEINSVNATAKRINKYPFGIELTLQGDSVVHHRMELYEGHDEFINRVNRGALVSKVRNSTDIMLINGADTTYYPLVY